MEAHFSARLLATQISDAKDFWMLEMDVDLLQHHLVPMDVGSILKEIAGTSSRTYHFLHFWVETIFLDVVIKVVILRLARYDVKNFFRMLNLLILLPFTNKNNGS